MSTTVKSLITEESTRMKARIIAAVNDFRAETGVIPTELSLNYKKELTGEIVLTSVSAALALEE